MIVRVPSLRFEGYHFPTAGTAYACLCQSAEQLRLRLKRLSGGVRRGQRPAGQPHRFLYLRLFDRLFELLFPLALFVRPAVAGVRTVPGHSGLRFEGLLTVFADFGYAYV